MKNVIIEIFHLKMSNMIQKFQLTNLLKLHAKNIKKILSNGLTTIFHINITTFECEN